MVEQMFPILLKVGTFILASGLLVLLYLWLFRGKASYNQSRIFLLVIPFFAATVTLIHVEWKKPLPEFIEYSPLVQWHGPPEEVKVATSMPVQVTERSPQVLTQTTVAQNRLNGHRILMALYLGVSLALLISLMLQIRKILKLKSKGKSEVLFGIEIVTHPDVPTPFSFYKSVYLNDRITSNKLDAMINHEVSHIHHKHYVDVFMIQILLRICWFNPFVWWIRKELESIAEYQADQSVLDEGLDIYQYQTLILEEVMSTNPFLASGLNDSFTKKRFMMMKKKPTFKFQLLRRVVIVPILLLMFGFFSISYSLPSDLINGDYSKYLRLNIRHLDANWDETSSMMIPSHALLKASSQGTADHSQAYFSYRFNEDTLIDNKTIKKELRLLASQIQNVLKETAHSGSENPEGSFGSIQSFITYASYHIDDRALGSVSCPKSMLSTISKENLKEWTKNLKLLQKSASKVAASSMSSEQKLIRYKYLLYLATSNDLIWTYLEPSMVKLALAGQTTTERIAFLRLNRKRLRNQINDAFIWKNAPRYGPSQVVLREPTYFKERSGIARIQRNEDDTRVTLFYTVGGNEWWFYFDKGLMIIDRATRDIYPIRAMEGGYPLNQTLVVTGSCYKFVEFTLIFPPLPTSVQVIDLVEYPTAPGNIMSDGGGPSRYEKLVLRDYAMK